MEITTLQNTKIVFEYTWFKFWAIIKIFLIPFLLTEPKKKNIFVSRGNCAMH